LETFVAQIKGDCAMSELEQERYVADLTALAECVARGVSDKSVLQLAGECGIGKRDIDVILNIREAA
jgi:predicted ATP-dependent serine protease